MCSNWKMPSDNELNTSEVKDIVTQGQRLSIDNCVFYGGEPLLRQDLPDIVLYVHAAHMQTEIITNGTLIDTTMAEKIVKSGVERITVSLDMCGDGLDAIRGTKDAYQRILFGLRELARLREGRNLEIKIASLLMLPTLKENNLLDVIALAERLRIRVYIQLLDFSLFYFQGVSADIRQQLWISAGYQKELEILVNTLVGIKKKSPWLIENSLASLYYIKKYFKDPKNKHIPCYLAFSGKVWVDPQGKVYLCQGLPPAGDLRSDTLENIVHSKEWRETVYRMFKKDCPGCSCMYASNCDAHLPLAWKDIALRKLSVIHH
jgi:radical SAM protein with 4Fe4S-binding SPASM domain